MFRLQEVAKFDHLWYGRVLEAVARLKHIIRRWNNSDWTLACGDSVRDNNVGCSDLELWYVSFGGLPKGRR